MALAILASGASAPAAAGSAREPTESVPRTARAVVASPTVYRASPSALQDCGAARAPTIRALSVGVDQAPGITAMHFRGPVNELRMFHNTLQAHGVDSATLMNPDHAQFVSAANQLLQQSRCGDRVLLHFSVPGQVHPNGPWVIYLPGFRESAASMGGEGVRQLDEVISAQELRSLVTMLRNQGADVIIFLDTGQAEASGLTDADRRRSLWSPSADADAPVDELLPGHGQLAAFYSSDRTHLPFEADTQLASGENVVATAFSVAVTAALVDPALRTARDLADAVTRSLEQHYRARHIGPGDAEYVRPVIEVTDPDLPLFDLATRAPTVPGAPTIHIDLPEQTRGAVRVPGTVLQVAGHLTPVPGAVKVLVNGDEAHVTADGRFTVSTSIDARQKSLRVVAITAPDLRVTTADLSLTPADAPAEPGGIRRRFALLIAEQAYPRASGFNPLSTPVGDSKAIRQVLVERYGFSTTFALDEHNSVNLDLVDASRRQITETLNVLRQHLTADDALVIFYAGHGWKAENGDVAYWIPVDAEADNWGTYISALDITTQLKAMAARHVLLISDSCYAGALSRGEMTPAVPPAAAADRSRFLDGLLARRSRVLVSSGADEPVDDGGGGGHSVFARAVLDGLSREQRPAFTAEELLVTYVQPYVVGHSAQSPQYSPLRGSGHEGGDFVFVQKSAP